ncbi:uncharacterized protein DS421_14g457590 [Arachis hypogaea]|nr:uncharacterized protein DS421_14g457590 [Arachis hypogaea]
MGGGDSFIIWGGDGDSSTHPQTLAITHTALRSSLLSFAPLLSSLRLYLSQTISSHEIITADLPPPPPTAEPLTDNAQILPSQSRRHKSSESSPSLPSEHPSLCATSQSSSSSPLECPSLYAASQPSPIFTDLRPSFLPSDRIQVNWNLHHYHYNYYKMKKA